MALEYKEFYNNQIEIGSKQIKFRPWNTKNEKDFLIAVEAEEEISDSMLYDLLVKPCMEDPTIVLDEHEQKILMIEIRKKSIGSSFPISYKCENCKKHNDLEVELDDVVQFSEPEYKDVTVENITIHFGSPASDNLIKRLDSIDSKVEKGFVDFLIHINCITIDGKLENTFSFNELKDYIESLPTYIFDEFYEEFSKMSANLKFELQNVCMFCDTVNKINLEGIPNFLWA